MSHKIKIGLFQEQALSQPFPKLPCSRVDYELKTSNPILSKMAASLPVWCQCLMLELNLFSFSPTVLYKLFLSDIFEDCLLSKKKFSKMFSVIFF